MSSKEVELSPAIMLIVLYFTGGGVGGRQRQGMGCEFDWGAHRPCDIFKISNHLLS